MGRESASPVTTAARNLNSDAPCDCSPVLLCRCLAGTHIEEFPPSKPFFSPVEFSHRGIPTLTRHSVSNRFGRCGADNAQSLSPRR